MQDGLDMYKPNTFYNIDTAMYSIISILQEQWKVIHRRGGVTWTWSSVDVMTMGADA